jgi:hypothetical protein
VGLDSVIVIKDSCPMVMVGYILGALNFLRLSRNDARKIATFAGTGQLSSLW